MCEGRLTTSTCWRESFTSWRNITKSPCSLWTISRRWNKLPGWLVSCWKTAGKWRLFKNLVFGCLSIVIARNGNMFFAPYLKMCGSLAINSHSVDGLKTEVTQLNEKLKKLLQMLAAANQTVRDTFELFIEVCRYLEYLPLLTAASTWMCLCYESSPGCLCYESSPGCCFGL